MRALRNCFLADDDEAIHWTDYAWLAAGYGVPIVISLLTVFAVRGL